MSGKANGTERRSSRFSLRVFLLTICILGAGLGLLGSFVRWNVERARLSQAIDPILTEHEAIVAVVQGEFVWLSLSRIDRGDADIQELHELGIAHFYSSVGLTATRPVSDVDLMRLLDRMPNLRVLDLRNTSTTTDVLPHVCGLKKLEWLWLDASHCTSASVDQLLEMTSLRRLTIDRTNLSDARIEELRSALPKCEIHTSP